MSRFCFSCRQSGKCHTDLDFADAKSKKKKFANGFALFYAIVSPSSTQQLFMPQHAAEDLDRSYSIKSLSVLRVLCAATAQFNIGLTANIDVPRATEDYMHTACSIIDASWDLCE